MHIRLLVLAVASLLLVPALHSPAATLQEDFSSDPTARGWRAFGDTNLFAWNSANQNLEVTWDSSQTNSYYSRWLGTILTAEDDFSLAFDIKLNDVTVGVNPAKPYTFELAVGFLNLGEATRTNFLRGAGTGTPDLLEFDYFPDDGSGPSVDATLSDTNSTFGFYWVNLPLTPGETYRVNLSYTASNQVVQAWLSQSNVVYGALTNSYLSTEFSDLRLDHVAVCSYSDAGQDPSFSGSLLAHGVVDNLVVTLPPPPVTNISGGFSGGKWQVQFTSQTNWLYTLERTLDLKTWTAASSPVNGNGANVTLQDGAQLVGNAFYRVKAARP